MAVTLNSGEIVNQADANTGYNQGSANTDIFVEPTASIGIKTSQTTNDFYTTSLGATAPYDYSGAGGESGQHIVCWFNVLGTPSGTDGFRILVGDGTSLGAWYVPPGGGYTGGFQPKVVNTAAAFDQIVSGSWTTGGNPGQLTNITQVGGGCNVTSKVTGNFINAMIDMFTTGTGLRVDAGTLGSPNTFETIRSQDEDTTHWGWVTSTAGAFLVRGGIYIGPSTGTATSVFNDTAAVVIFTDNRVATGFYDINIRGTNTDVDFSGCVILAENPTNARWSLTLDGTSIPTFDDNGSLFQGFDTITLRSGSTLTNTALDNGSGIIQNSGTLTGCNIVNANTTTGNAFITSNNPTNISNCDFTFSAGHAIEITQTGTYTFTGNTFTGYLGTPGSNPTPNSGSNDAAIYNNSGGSVTLNITGGGSTPSVRNGASASTTIAQSVPLKITVLDSNNNPVQGAQVWVQKRLNDLDVGHPGNPFTSAATGNNQGDLDFVVQESPPSDLPASGWIEVRDNTGATVNQHNYRYASRSATTFTFNTKVGPFACSGGGTSTSLQDTVRNFLTMETAGDIAEGDTIRNETDGSWATVLQIVDADNVTTTPLKGGTDNTWTSGDNYSLHSLAVSYDGSDKATVPLMNKDTNASGVAEETYGGSNKDVVVRVRRSSATEPQYLPVSTNQTIGTNGLDLIVTVTEDTIR